MPFGNFIGGFGPAFAQGVQHSQQLELQREEHRLRGKMIDAQLKHQEFQNKQIQNQLNAAQQGAASYEQSLTGAHTTPGYEDPNQALSVAPVTTPGTRAMTPQETITKAAIGAGHFPAGMFSQHANQPQHIPPGSLIPNPNQPGQFMPAYTGPTPETEHQKNELIRQNRALDIQSENAKATREATAEQRAFTNQMATQTASDRAQRIKDAQARTQQMDEQHKASLYQQALKEKAKNEPGVIRRMAESLGWPAPASRAEEDAFVESLKPGGIRSAPKTADEYLKKFQK